MEITKEDLLSCSVHLSEDERAVVLLDQTQLPNRTEYLTLDTVQEIYDAIKVLAVRGAPAIGICAGYAMYVLARKWCEEHDDAASLFETFSAAMEKDGDYLISSRPTAVNLAWAVNRMMKVIREEGPAMMGGDGPAADGQGAAASGADGDSCSASSGFHALVSRLHDEAVAIHREDIEMCRRIAEYGLSLIKPGDGILTHCNAGALATSKYGTATGPMYLAKEKGIPIRVFSDETRPLLQGARLTSYELEKAGIDVTLICDNMASMVMKNGWVQAVFVGCDRIAANGDFANKIGTSGVAILAKHYGIPFYTLGPRSTIDMDCSTGDDIRIEQRDPDEIKNMWYAEPMALPEVKCFNPAFDVTDHELLTAIVTDKGIVYPPFEENLKKIMEED